MRKGAALGHRPVAVVSLTLVAAAVLVVAVSLVLAGCGSSGGSSSGTAPDFQVQTLAYENVSLGAYRGKPLVLAFMASW